MIWRGSAKDEDTSDVVKATANKIRIAILMNPPARGSGPVRRADELRNVERHGGAGLFVQRWRADLRRSRRRMGRNSTRSQRSEDSFGPCADDGRKCFQTDKKKL